MAADRRYMIVDGELLAWQPREGAYIYQYIHTLDYKLRNAEPHIEILHALSQELFGQECNLTIEELMEQAERLFMATRPSRQRSIRIIAKQYASGSYSIDCDTPSLYQGYTLRSLRPEMATMRVTMPLEIYPTSAAVATREVAESIARSRDFHAALLMGDDEHIYSESTSPVALVQGRRLLLAPQPYSVEQEKIEQAAQNANIEVERRTLYREDVLKADEVLTIDWQGITAADKVDGKQYMAIIAERLAREMERVSKQ